MSLRPKLKFYAVRLADKAGWLSSVDPRFISGYYEQWESPIYQEITANGRRRASHSIKRIVDVFGSLSALILLAPVLLAVSLLIKITSRGSVVFALPRVGRNGKKFMLYKFRTMNEAVATEGLAEAPVWSKANDPRLTRFGLFLRKTSLDELPEFWNVLMGDMTLVGPRPLTEWQIRYLNDQKMSRELRLRLQPGITGIWLDGCIKPRRRPSDLLVADLLREQEMLLRYMTTRSVMVDTFIFVQAIINWLVTIFTLSADKELET